MRSEGTVARLNRVQMFAAALVFPIAAVVVLVACSGGGGSGPTAVVATPTAVPPATPPCSGAERVTPAQGEGPFFKAGSPERASLIEPGYGGDAAHGHRDGAVDDVPAGGGGGARLLAGGRIGRVRQRGLSAARTSDDGRGRALQARDDRAGGRNRACAAHPREGGGGESRR